MTRDRRLWLLIALAFLLSLPAVTTRIYASDEIQYFSWLRSWAFDRDVDFENEYRYFYDTGAARNPDFHETFLERTNEAGRRINFAPIGTAILWAPFYAVGHVVALATGARADGLSAPYIAAVSYGSACYGFLAVWLSARIAGRIVGRGVLAAVVIWIGTPLVYYMYVTPPFSHACSAFAVALFITVWLRVRDSWSPAGAAWLGLTGALMAMVREQDMFFIAGPAIDFVWKALAYSRPKAQGQGPRLDTATPSAQHLAHRVAHTAPGTQHPAPGVPHPAPIGPRTAITAALVGAVSFLLAFAPQLLAYNSLNGHPSPTELVERKMIWTSPHALEVLFSPAHGLFAWTPLALLALSGVVLLALGHTRGGHPEARRIGAIALVMVAAQVYITGAVDSWTLQGSFGQRRFVGLTPILTVGLAALFAAAAASPLWRRALAAAVAICLWWNLGLIAQFALHRMDRQRLTLRENAWQTFVVLPREAPAILWRYLTDRSSFYGRQR